MKKLAALFLIFALLPVLAFAETTPPDNWDALLKEKDQQIADLESRLDSLQKQLDALIGTPQSAAEAEPAVSSYSLLKKGSKGDAVAALQKRLKELGYLSGKADGGYGAGTASAVKDYQKVAGLPETGEADSTTQESIFSDSAPVSPNPVADETTYEKLDYKANSRDPDAYTGKKIKFSGKILQVMEDDGYAVFRIATKGGYDNVVYCLYVIPENYKRFLEDDTVTVYAVSTGIYMYESVMGGSITIPACTIDRITLK